ncbi:MAG: hypothetical protein D6715_14465 [Calditrichaeota bacterium]|nr:MAG: hypothetical protein D6715_14465 [Calditrichota bacterium]
MKFLLDGMLRGLARWLRFLGWDAQILQRWEADEIRRWYQREPDRVFVSRSRAHVEAWPGQFKVLLSSDDVAEQLQQLNERFSLVQPDLFLSRCSRCNQPLVAVRPEAVRGKVPERVFERFREFYLCPGCQRIYWEGGHVERLIKKLQRMGLFFSPNCSNQMNETGRPT